MGVKAVVIGAGPGGLAAAACLKQSGVDVLVLDRANRVGDSWHRHYKTLTLHTTKTRSALPGLAYPDGVGRYPTRDDVCRYLADYASHHRLNLQLGHAVSTVSHEGKEWRVVHDAGVIRSDCVVIATGMNTAPRMPDWPGAFDGAVSHAADYVSAAPFRGQRMLVAGFGNSAGDIACDLVGAGCDVTLAVRGPVSIVPKELFGLPITSLGGLGKLLGYRVADRLTAPVLRLVIGRPEDYGLRSTDKGPSARVIEDGRIPLIDMGLLRMIKNSQVRVKPAVLALEGTAVQFADHSSTPIDAIIAATGYTCDLRPLLGRDCPALDSNGQPKTSGGPTGLTGLYFCGYRVSTDGQLGQIAKEARAIAADAAQWMAAERRSKSLS